jgi:hypothetical protein
MMDRRHFLLTSLAGALAGPLGAQAQQAGNLPRVGYLSNSSSYDDPDAGFFAGLREHGYEPNRDISSRRVIRPGTPGGSRNLPRIWFDSGVG